MSKHELIAVSNYNDGVNMVINDQADAMVADKPICVLSVMRYPGKDLVTRRTTINHRTHRCRITFR